jgi:hypothetical protein
MNWTNSAGNLTTGGDRITECLVRMLRAAGFARADVIRCGPFCVAVVKAHRRWGESRTRVTPFIAGFLMW